MQQALRRIRLAHYILFWQTAAAFGNTTVADGSGLWQHLGASLLGCTSIFCACMHAWVVYSSRSSSAG
jgi:hypothetical protein